MAINSYFYDSVNGDRPYSAGDFAKAFDIAFETGVLIREDQGGTMGLDIGGVNYTTIYEGKAIIEGHFVEVTGTEILTVPAGTYSGQIVIRTDMTDERAASLVVKEDRAPIQSAALYELPLYNANVTDGIITAVGDLRYRGGAIPNNHNHTIAEVEGLSTGFASANHTHTIANITGLQTELNAKALTSNTPKWTTYADGGYLECGISGGKTFRIYLTSTQPWDGDANDRHVWIQTDA